MDTLDLEYWMTNLPQQLRQLPFIHLAIPGSHDSMTSSITSSSEIAPDAEGILKHLNWMGPFIRNFIYKWCKTQDLDAYTQLKYGIRYFDLRVATKPKSVYPYFVHGLYASEVTSALNDIHNFLEKHPHEMVILDFQHFYEFTEESHETLITLLSTIFKDQLVPKGDYINTLTLDSMTVTNKNQVLIIYRNFICFDYPFLWDYRNYPTPWPNTTSLSELIMKLNMGLVTRWYQSGYVSQFLLTPTGFFVLKHLFSDLKTECVIPIYKEKCEWIRQQNIGIPGVNVIISDFIDLHHYEFVVEVINLNYKYLESHSSNLTLID